MPESISDVKTASQTNIGGVNFGNVQVGSISGTKYNDLNGNGVQEPNEPPLANWQIFLDLNNNGRPDANEPLTVTNVQGNYFFANLPPGTYLTREVQQPFWRQTTPNPGPIPIVSGSNFTNVNFGNNFFVGSISGTKFNDLNANGLRDLNEPPLANWQIYLDLNNNGQLDGGELSTFTNAQGNYLFVNVPAGTYSVREVQQPNFRQTTPNPVLVTVTPGVTVNNINFGNSFFVGSISGLKFNDLNANGVRDATEPTLSNWQIYLDLNGNGRLEFGEPTTLTNVQGNYTFANVPSGNYLVREVLQPGWIQTTPNPGPVSIVGNTNATGVNFGNNFVVASISGFKFNDLNADGVNEPGEPRIANWPIYLDLNGNGRLDVGEPSTLTNAQGNFTFTNLPPGTYLVREVQQPGFRQTTPNPTALILGNGVNASNISFGNTLVLGSISGIKFNDFNVNGRLDPGEPPIPNAQIYIDLNNNSRLEPNEPSTVTDSQGNYSFRNIPVGTYVLREVVPPGFLPTTPPAVVTVTSGPTASSLDPLTGMAGSDRQSAELDALISGDRPAKERGVPDSGVSDSLLIAKEVPVSTIPLLESDSDLRAISKDFSLNNANIAWKSDSTLTQMSKIDKLIAPEIGLPASIINVSDLPLNY